MLVGVVVVLLVVAVVLAGTVVIAVRIARRKALTGEASRSEVRNSTSLGKELAGRELRLEAVLDEAGQARKLAELSGTYLAQQLDDLGRKLEAGAEAQRAKVHAVGPLTGPSREYALTLVDPGIAHLEASGREVLALAQRAAAAQDEPGAEDLSRVGDEARALQGALDELESVDDTQRRIERMLQGAPPPKLPAQAPRELPPQAN